MRGVPSLISDIRKKVFTEVARMAYNGDDYTKAEDLPFLIVPGDQPLHRESIFRKLCPFLSVRLTANISACLP